LTDIFIIIFIWCGIITMIDHALWQGFMRFDLILPTRGDDEHYNTSSKILNDLKRSSCYVISAICVYCFKTFVS
jgi:hypothetical protein